VLTTNAKGAIAETRIAAAATELGVSVLRPIVEHGRYDLAFEVGDRILRVQCKWGALDSGAGVVKVNLQSCRHTPNQGYVYTQYQADEIDLVAVYCGGLERCYLLPVAKVAGMGGIFLRLTPPRNGQRACINLASDYEFPGAIAQLGERLRGTQEVAGSSPASSTTDGERASALTIGAHQFRNHFGYYLDRAAEGKVVHVSRRGRPYVCLGPMRRQAQAVRADG
jgi:prevent-host-death family protein